MAIAKKPSRKKKAVKKTTAKKKVVTKRTLGLPTESGVAYHSIKVDPPKKKISRKKDEKIIIPIKIAKVTEEINERIQTTQQNIKKRSPIKKAVKSTCNITVRCICDSYKSARKFSFETILLLGFVIGVVFIFIIITQSEKTYKSIAKFHNINSITLGYSISNVSDIKFKTLKEAPKDFDDVDLTEFWQVWRLLEKDFVPQPLKEGEEIDLTKPHKPERSEFVRSAIEGLTWATRDKYTNYIYEEDSEKFENEVINGSISGIGSYIGLRNGLLTIIRPIPESPSEKAGLKSGDVIKTIDGEVTTYLNLTQSTRKIRGTKGTNVSLGILRPNTNEDITIVVTRNEVNIPTVETEIKKGVFIIKLLTFTQKTPKAFVEALEEYTEYSIAQTNSETGSPMIIDMRGNAGGVLSTAIFIAGLFLEEDSVVLYDYHGSTNLRAYKSSRQIFSKEVPPITILVDHGSASASEILAAALQHYGVAEVVGTITTGKGSVQTLKKVGKNSLLKLTIAQWLTPSKESISDIGVTPDIDYTEEIRSKLKEDFDFDFEKFLLDKAIEHANL